jgi:hypothetical protein
MNLFAATYSGGIKLDSVMRYDSNKVCEISYHKDLVFDDVLDTLGLAKIGVQGLFDPLKADTAIVQHDIAKNKFTFGDTEASRTLARLFYVFALKEFGQHKISCVIVQLD